MKQDTTSMTTFRLPISMLQQAKEKAKESKISLAEFVEQAILEFFLNDRKFLSGDESYKEEKHAYTSIKLSKKLIKKARIFAVGNEISFGKFLRLAILDRLSKGWLGVK